MEPTEQPESFQAQAAAWPPLHTHYVYAAKFLCGELRQTDREGPVQPGRYSTAINVHNPHHIPVVLRKKAILLYDGEHPEKAKERPLPPVKQECPVVRELRPDYGLEIDCPDIRDVLLRDAAGNPGPQAPVFIKGWVVIETMTIQPLDVVAVYTTESVTGEPTTPAIAIERVPGTRTLVWGF
jgi:hypothetical protein